MVAGVIPALRVTGGTLQPTLQSTAAGRSTLRLGRVAGALIVIEVGLAVVALFVGVMAWRLCQRAIEDLSGISRPNDMRTELLHPAELRMRLTRNRDLHL